MTNLWSIEGGGLKALSAGKLASEDQLEDWLERDISILDPDLLIIGRQVATPHGGRMDLLAINGEGSLSVIELKRDRTPRNIVSQVLDYASWVSWLDTPEVHSIADAYWLAKGSSFAEAFRKKFDSPPPEPLNLSHSMVVVASSLDPASQRIVEYLSQTHDVGINTAFFNVFTDGERDFLAADWLMEQEEVIERTQRRARSPWSGYWYVNAGEGEHRNWDDMRKLGFIAAGGGRTFSGPLDKLSAGAPIYVYQKGHGYVGHGLVKETAVMARECLIDGRPLLEYPLQQPRLAHDQDDDDLAEYVVQVDWHEAVALQDAKTFTGIFANQNVVCKLRDPNTLSFLANELGALPI